MRGILEQKRAYTDRLLAAIRQLEERVSTAKERDAVSFSFFREAFDNTEAILRLLHEMENLQIEEMKAEMEKLIAFLSETKSQAVTPDPVADLEDTAAAPEAALLDSAPEPDEAELAAQPEAPLQNTFAEGIVLPEYVKPTSENWKGGADAHPVSSHAETVEIPSLNDTIRTGPKVVDLKRGVSLNDRFFFQRELFNNDRHEMNGVMLRLQAFGTYEEAEMYLRENMVWDFGDETVKDFLSVIRKGFQ